MRLFRYLRSLNNGSSSSSINPTPTVSPDSPNVVRKLFGKYLLLTNTLSAGVLMVAGDLAAQEYEFRANKKDGEVRVERINWTRVGE